MPFGLSAAWFVGVGEAEGSLTRRTAVGMASTTTAMLLTAVFQVIYTAVMARLLTPREFGLLAMANVVIGLTSQLSRFGVGPALIQHPRLDETMIRTATTIAWAFGVAGTLVILGLSPVAGWFFDEPAVVPVLMALAVAVTIAAVALVPEALLRRALRFQWLAGIDVVSFAIGYLGVGIISALMGAGVWSLVAATLSQALVKTLALFLVERRGLRPGWTRLAAQRIASFGSQVTAIGLVQYGMASLPTLFVGRSLGSGLLGQFNRADLLIRLPLERLTTTISRVLFPALATVNREPTRFFVGYSLATAAAAALVLPAAFFVGLLAGPIVATLLGPGWEQAAAVLPLLAAAAGLGYLTHFAGVALEALGRLRGKLMSEVAASLLLLVGLVVFVGGGLLRVAAVILTVEMVRFAAQFVLLAKVVGSGIAVVLRPLRAGVLLGSLIALTVIPVRSVADGWSSAAILIVGMLAAGVSVAVAQLLPPVAELRRDVRARLQVARASAGERTAAPPT